MATAELAVALPALVLLLATMLGVFDLAVAQIRCVDSARAAARSAARGDSQDQVRAMGARAGPPGAVVAVSTTNGMVHVRVTAPVARLARVLPLPFRPSATASAIDETVGGPP